MRRIILSLILIVPTAAFAADEDEIKKLCTEAFGDDYTMVDFCRKQQLDAATVLKDLRKTVDDGSEQAAILSDCQKDAMGDFRTALNCAAVLLKARDASLDLAADVPADVADRIEMLCPPRAGPNNAAMTYCVKKQIKGYLDLEPNSAGLPDDVAQQIRSKCYDKAEGDISNMSFCVGEQAQAWRDLQ